MSPQGSASVAPSNPSANQNDNITLSCFAQGGPSNSFQWSLDSQTLPGETNQVLTLLQVTTGGVYGCTVTNAAGMDSSTAVLTGEWDIILIISISSLIFNSELFPCP